MPCPLISLMNNEEENNQIQLNLQFLNVSFRLRKREALTSSSSPFPGRQWVKKNRTFFPPPQGSLTKLLQQLEGHSDLIIFVYK